MSGGRKRLAVIAGAVALAILGSTAGYLLVGSRTASAAPPQYVGRVFDSNAFIGINKNGRKIQAYVCDGTHGHISIHEWFTGLALHLICNAADALRCYRHACGRMCLDDLSGMNELDGMMFLDYAGHLFANAGVTLEGIHYGRNWVGGWIQLPNGEQRGPALAYVYDCGCYSARKWCRNAYGVWHDFGPGSC